MDSGHRETEQKLKKLEQRISKEYRQAEAEISAKLADYMKRYETKDKIWQKWVEDGKKTAKQYEEWRIGQLAMGERWKQMRDTLAEDFHHVNNIAKSVMNGYMPEVYCINHDYATYEIEHGLKIDTSYTLYDRQTAELLLSDEAVGKRAQRIADVKDITWNKKQVQSTMLQGIIQGKSIPDLATSLALAVGEKNRKAAIRNARTMTTGVQNAGRVAGYERAKEMGIDTRMQWVATLDGRTRHEHRLLDGQVRDTDEPFEVDGEKIRFPGDPQAAPRLVYNCRCTLIAAIKGFERNLSDLSIRRSDKMGDMTYEEWKEAKAKSEPIDKQDKIAETMKGIYTNIYKGL